MNDAPNHIDSLRAAEERCAEAEADCRAALMRAAEYHAVNILAGRFPTGWEAVADELVAARGEVIDAGREARARRLELEAEGDDA